MKYSVPSFDEIDECLRYGDCPVLKRKNQLRKLQRAFKSAQIPARYLGKTFADYTVDKFNQEAVAFAKNFDKFSCGAYFFGKCGSGKTFLASLIAQDFLRREHGVVFIKVPDLLDEIRSTFDGKGSETDMLNALSETELVILDDFGMEKPTQWAGSTMCKILDRRYDNPKLRTIVTSNLSLDQLAAQLNNATDGRSLNGERVADRCREICKPIFFGGNSRR